MIEGIKIVDYLSRKKSYQKHLDRLKRIVDRKQSPSKQPHANNYHLLKTRTRRLKTDEFKKSIEVENKKILNKIVDISTRASETSFRKTAYKSKPHHHSYYSRVKIYDMINHENPSILKRIASQSGHISSQEQQRSYQQTLKLKSYVQKFPYTKNIRRKMKAIQDIITNRKPIQTSRIQVPTKYTESTAFYEQIGQIVLF